MNTIQVNKKIHIYIFSLHKNPKSRHVEGCGAGPGRSSPGPSRVVAVDEAAELLGHGVYQLLLVPLVFPKLGENVVFPARVSHPAQSRNRLWNRRYRCSTLQPSPAKGSHVMCPYLGSAPIIITFLGKNGHGEPPTGSTVGIFALNPTNPRQYHCRVCL